MKVLRLAIAILFVGTTALAQQKVALVIGAQNYSSLPRLRNSLNDARAMAAKLQVKGFQVEALYDPKTKREVRDAITRYYNIMRDKVGGVGIIFYAGHGMQYEGDNYIIPTTASLQNPGDLEDQCVKMNTVMAVLKSSGKSLNILLLDACRSLPSFTRDTDQGLTRMEAPQGSIIVFATQPGKVASDGTGQNGLFTAKLMKVIDEPNLNITDVFKKVKQEVFAESRESQLPSVEDNSIGGDFYFSGRGPANSLSANAGDGTSVPKKILLKIVSDKKCKIFMDDVEMGVVEANASGKFTVTGGKCLIKAVSLENEADVFSDYYEGQYGKAEDQIQIDFSVITEKRRLAEEKAKQLELAEKKKNCQQCHGTGYFDQFTKCQSCSGSGSLTCYSCSGVGLKTCSECKGKGKTVDGFLIEKCTKCHGTGNMSCKTCRGTGKLPDSNCGGTGRLTVHQVCDLHPN